MFGRRACGQGRISSTRLLQKLGEKSPPRPPRPPLRVPGLRFSVSSRDTGTHAVLLCMATSRRFRLHRTASISDALLQVSITLVALASSCMGASAPPRGGSVDGLGIAPQLAASVSRNSPAHAGRRHDHRRAAGGEPTSAAPPDDFLTFCVNLNELPEQLAVSRDYRVVAVTGCQCSGKSTLMNALFGTG